VKQPSPVTLANLAGAGTIVIGSLVMGLIAGLAAERFLHWDWAVPAGIIIGFGAGITLLFRRLSTYM